MKLFWKCVILSGIVAVAGCGQQNTSPSPPPAAPPIVQKPADSTDIQAAQTPAQKKLHQYTSASYDADRANVREWLSKRPESLSVRTVKTGNDSDLQVKLQPTIDAKQSRTFAHDVKVYLTAHLSGDRAFAVSQVSLLGGKTKSKPDSEQSQTDQDPSAQVAAVVTTAFNAGTSSNDAHPDTTWHVFVDGDQVE